MSTVINNSWIHFSSSEAIFKNLQEIGDPHVISIIGENISQNFANTTQDLNSIKRNTLPLTFEYGFAICDKNSLHYNPEKCDNFRFNINSIHNSIYSTICHSRCNSDIKLKYV